MSTNSNAENIVTRFGMQAFIFPISSAGINGAVVQSLGVTNIGDTTLNVTKIYLSPPRASSLKKPQQSREISERCQERSFRILGCYDRENVMNRDNFIAKFLSRLLYFRTAARSISKFSVNEPNLLNGFTVQPGENHIIHISHTPDCIFRSLFTIITFEYHDVDLDLINQGSKEDDKMSLLLGYEDDHLNPRPCVPLLESVQSVQFNPTLEEDESIGMISLLRQYIGFRFFGRWLIDFFSKLIPFILFILIVIDVVSSSRNRHFHLLERRIGNGTVEGNYDLGNSVYEQYTDSVVDLIQLSRDEIKKSLIAKYKNLGMTHSLSIYTNGSLTKSRVSVTGSGIKCGHWNHQSTSEIMNSHSIRRSTGGAKLMPYFPVRIELCSKNHLLINAQYFQV